jgi:galactonate dehydratase
VGWGETYGIVAAEAVRALVADLIGPYLEGKDPLDVQAHWQALYNMMRVRGYTTGFWLDALAAADIALWDLCGQLLQQPLHRLLGGARRAQVPAYITSIAGADLLQRLDEVARLRAEGYAAFKVHAASSFDPVELIRQMRDRFPDVEIMLDLHWCYTAAEAIAIARQIEPYRVSFLEAPCHTEDLDGLARVGRSTSIPVAAGEEWRTAHDAHARLKSGTLGVIQPEMGRTGITQFLRICQLAEVHHVRVAPHATIGFGLFMAASLHASAATWDLPLHELQNNAFGKHLDLFDTDMACGPEGYILPTGPGLGIQPKPELLALAEPG